MRRTDPRRWPLGDSPECNLRDVGGLRTVGGWLTRWGRLYRSGDGALRLGGITSLRLATIIDLRMAGEAETRTVPAGAVCHAIPLFDAARSEWIDPADQRPESVARRYLEMLEDAAEALHLIVALLARPASLPTLIHCAAGRDRTGIVTAALLAAVDVEDRAISADYALTADSIGGGRAAAEAMMAFLELVEQAHGGMERFLIHDAGCREQAISALRAALVDTSSGDSERSTGTTTT